jgi:hypothetical protein
MRTNGSSSTCGRGFAAATDKCRSGLDRGRRFFAATGATVAGFSAEAGGAAFVAKDTGAGRRSTRSGRIRNEANYHRCRDRYWNPHPLALQWFTSMMGTERLR